MGNTNTAQTTPYKPRFNMGSKPIENPEKLTNRDLCLEIFNEMEYNSLLSGEEKETLILNIQAQIFYRYTREKINCSIKSQFEKILNIKFDSFSNSKQKEFKILKLLYKKINLKTDPVNILQILKKPSFFNIFAEKGCHLIPSMEERENKNGTLLSEFLKELEKEIPIEIIDKYRQNINEFVNKFDKCLFEVAYLLENREIEILSELDEYITNSVKPSLPSALSTSPDSDLFQTVYLKLLFYQCRLIRKPFYESTYFSVSVNEYLKKIRPNFCNSKANYQIIFLEDIPSFLDTHKEQIIELFQEYIPKSSKAQKQFFSKLKNKLPILAKWSFLNSEEYKCTAVRNLYAMIASIVIGDYVNYKVHMTYYGVRSTKNSLLLTDLINSQKITDPYYHSFWVAYTNYVHCYLFYSNPELIVRKYNIQSSCNDIMLHFFSFHDFDDFCTQTTNFFNRMQKEIAEKFL